MIKRYKENDLKSGFVGFRVAVSVNGKVINKYFSDKKYYTETGSLLAKEEEIKLLKKQLFYRRNKLRSKTSNTGLLNFRFANNTTTKRDKVYTYATITFQCMKDGKSISKMHTLKDGLLTDLDWEDLCLFAKNTRTITAKNYELLRGLKPNPKKFISKRK